jgi:hypothetical protein
MKNENEREKIFVVVAARENRFVVVRVKESEF